MALSSIDPQQKRKKGGLGGAIGSIAGTVIGGIGGAIAAPFTAGMSIPAGLAAGAALGGGLGGTVGALADPVKGGGYGGNVSTMNSRSKLQLTTQMPEVQLAQMQRSKALLAQSSAPDAMKYISMIDQAQEKVKSHLAQFGGSNGPSFG